MCYFLPIDYYVASSVTIASATVTINRSFDDLSRIALLFAILVRQKSAKIGLIISNNTGFHDIAIGLFLYKNV